MEVKSLDLASTSRSKSLSQDKSYIHDRSFYCTSGTPDTNEALKMPNSVIIMYSVIFSLMFLLLKIIHPLDNLLRILAFIRTSIWISNSMILTMLQTTNLKRSLFSEREDIMETFKWLKPLISWAGQLDVARLPSGVAAAAHTQWSPQAFVRRGAPGGNGRPEPTLNLERTAAFVFHFSALCFYSINYTFLVFCFSSGSILTVYTYISLGCYFVCLCFAPFVLIASKCN